jgi:radical SAM superfamily enzyme YgiQ (UPF0313 family)
MNHTQPTLKKSIAITNATISLICVAYILDALSDTLVGRLGLTWTLLFLLPFHVYLYSGTLGSLTELASGQEMLLRKDLFLSNVKKYLKYYLAIYVVFVVAGYFLVHHFSFGTLDAFMLHMRLPLLTALSAVIVWDKYLRREKDNKGKFNFNFEMITTLLVLLILNVFMALSPRFIDTSQFYLSNFLGFCSRYLFFLSYVYITLVIIKQYPVIERTFVSQKDLFFINPYPYGGDLLTGIAYTLWDWHPPVFVVLKALSPKNYKIREFNNVIWEDRFYKENALVAITCYTSNSPEAYKLAKQFRQKGSKVIMGGPHVLNMPEEALDYCDCVVVGDVEGVWQQIIKDYETGSLKRIYRGELTEEKFGEIYQELLNSPPEITKDYLEPTRGCKFKCHFCAIPGNIGEARIQARPIAAFVSLIEKIRHKYNRDLYFIDSNIYSNPSYAKELFEAIKPLNITWQSAATIDIGKSVEMVKLARESGCSMLLCGYEIPQGSTEKDKDQKFAMTEKYIEYTRNITSEGINVKGTFMFGWDSDSWSSLLDLWKFCFKLRPQITTLSILTPIPGSKLFWQMLNENRIINLNWRNYAFYNLVFKHKNLDNYFFPKIFRFVRYIFFFTTSSTGMKAAVWIAALLLLILKVTS